MIGKFFMIKNHIKIIKNSEKIYPSTENIYKAFNYPLKNIKIIIIGQDPYHGENQANGLAFAVNNNIKPPPSLKNIMKESVTKDKTLLSWAEQGVFLLNTCLTVAENSPLSHSGKGWEIYTYNAIDYLLNNNKNDLIFCLWGKNAQLLGHKLDLDNRKNVIKIIKTSHPSPLSANKTSSPFIGSDQFKLLNQLTNIKF